MPCCLENRDFDEPHSATSPVLDAGPAPARASVQLGGENAPHWRLGVPAHKRLFRWRVPTGSHLVLHADRRWPRLAQEWDRSARHTAGHVALPNASAYRATRAASW